MLHHGGQRDGNDGQAGRQAELGHLAAHYREGNGFGFLHAGEIHSAHEQGHNVGADDTQQNGQDLDHALAPDVAGHHNGQSHQSQHPVGLAVLDGRGSQDQADGDDDGTGNHRREKAHDLLNAEHADENAHHHIHQTRDHDAAAGIGQHLGVGQGSFTGGGVHQLGRHQQDAAQESKGRTQEGGNLALGDQMEQQCADTGAEQSGGHAEPGEKGYQHRCAEHGEGVLQTQDQHFGHAQGPCVIDALLHRSLGLLRLTHKKPHRTKTGFRPHSRQPANKGPLSGPRLPYIIPNFAGIYKPFFAFSCVLFAFFCFFLSAPVRTRDFSRPLDFLHKLL